MEPEITSALITAGVTLLGLILGYLLKSISGEPRANVRNITAQAKKAEAEADSEYARLAREAAADLRLLREEYEADKESKERELVELRQRIEKLEKDNREKDQKIALLQEENAALRRSLSRKGLALRSG